jgi:hypothetical protein
MALIGAIGFMAVMVGAMFVVTFAANEATKETHAKGNALVDKKGVGLATVQQKAMIKLSELSRASHEYLANLEDVTVVTSDKKVVHHQITGYTHHDADNLDMYTASGTTIKIQCGAIRLYDEDGVTDAEEMHGEAAAGARQLRAMTYEELHAEYNALASAETRKLAATNPLQGMYSFFGGMAKSSANSQLYGELVPVTGCKKPKSIIKVTRPNIPSVSKWTVEANKVDNAGKAAEYLRDDTWYMQYDDKDNADVAIRFESPEKECYKRVNLDAGGKLYSWTEFDLTLCATMSKDAKPDTSMCNKEMSEADCTKFLEAMKKAYDSQLDHDNGEKTGCTATDKPAAGADKPVTRIIDINEDGSSQWQFGGFVMDFNSDGEPIAIVNGDKKYKVKVEPFDMSKGDKEDVFVGSCPNKDAKPAGRRLGFGMSELQQWLSDTDWCGSGTDNANTPCPGAGRGNFADNMGCRRHDHGAKHESTGPFVKLECKVDKDLNDYTNNWAAIATFGDSAKNRAAGHSFLGIVWPGLAATWGCHNYVHKQNCWWHWAGCGWRGCPGWQRHCSSSWQWETKKGGNRYDGVGNRGNSVIYKAKSQTCPNDIW